MGYLVPFVIERTGRGERSYDIYSRLLKDRIIMLGSAIDDDVANVVIAQMLFLQMENKNSDRRVFILEEIAEIEKLEVSDEELDHHISHLARRHGKWPNEMRQKLEKEGSLGHMKTNILLDKVKEFLLDNAEIEEKDGPAPEEKPKKTEKKATKKAAKKEKKTDDKKADSEKVDEKKTTKKAAKKSKAKTTKKGKEE